MHLDFLVSVFCRDTLSRKIMVLVTWCVLPHGNMRSTLCHCCEIIFIKEENRGSYLCLSLLGVNIAVPILCQVGILLPVLLIIPDEIIFLGKHEISVEKLIFRQLNCKEKYI